MSMIPTTPRVPSLLAALLLAACATTSGETEEVVGASFHDDFDGSERVWIGPSYWANRFADWKRDGEALVCVETRRAFPFRTVHLLGHRVQPGYATRVRIERRPGSDATATPGESWAGFLLGAGGAHVEPRLTAMVHHRPAEDGGLLVVVDEGGVVRARDFSLGGGGGLWSIAGPVEASAVPELELGPGDERRGEGFGARGPRPVVLAVDVATDGTLVASAVDTAGNLVSRLVLHGIATEQLDGGVALVSHLGDGHRFDDWSLAGDGVRARPDGGFGPVFATQYTVHDSVLKLTAQTGPLGAGDVQEARLELQEASGAWRTAAAARLLPDSWTFPFRVEGFAPERDVPFRVVYRLRDGEDARDTTYAGLVRTQPRHANDFVIASLNCHKTFTGGLRWNANGLWFPHAELVRAVASHRPDLLFFAGDQIYEGDLTPAEGFPEERGLLDYLYKWSRFCWAFGDLLRTTPTVMIPDDHDVYHGNIWGAGGKRAERTDELSAQDAGGYKHSGRFVNVVHATQTSHLPDPVDPAPIEQGITVYFTELVQGGVSFAILADRMFKSAPAPLLPEGRVVNGWFQNAAFDPVTQADVPGAELLGPRQERFLANWATARDDDVWAKVALSQTLFANVATLPRGAASGSVLPSLPIPAVGAYPPDHVPAADLDSSGWPQTPRLRALRSLAAAGAIHLAGDQHLGSLIQYGLDGWRDGPLAMCSPAIANTWPRRWFPETPGKNRAPGSPLYTGDFEDGFGNKLTVFAVANPSLTGLEPAGLHDRAPGYGIVRLSRTSDTVTFEAWPRSADPTRLDARNYPGWPRSFPLPKR